jgi:hypothetical protein
LYDLNDCIRPDEEERASMLAKSTILGYSIDLELLHIGYPKDLKWLLEIAENKKTHFPHLKRVSLVEHCGFLRSGIHPMNWRLPPVIKDAFNRADIALRGVLRVSTEAPTVN